MLTIFSKYNWSSKYCRGHVECNFDIRAENFSPKPRKLFAQSPKILIKLTFSENNRENVPLDTQNAVLTTMPKIFRQSLKILSLRD